MFSNEQLKTEDEGKAVKLLVRNLQQLSSRVLADCLF